MAKRSIGSLYVDLTVQDNMSKALKKADASISKFAKSAGARIAGIVSVGAIGTGLWKSIDAASDMAETLSKSSVVFGDNAKEIQKWATTSATMMGLSQRAAMESAASFGNLFVAMGAAPETIVPMSKSLVQLASDLASLNNIQVEEATTRLFSGIVGETEAVRRFGVDVSETAVKLELMRMGVEKVGGEYTQSQKILARYNLMMSQTGTAQGDFVRTADLLANSQRTINALWEDGKVTVGNGLLPVMTDLAAKMKEVDFQGLASGINTMTSAALAAAGAYGKLLKLLEKTPNMKAVELAGSLAYATSQESRMSAPTLDKQWQSLVEQSQKTRQDIESQFDALNIAKNNAQKDQFGNVPYMLRNDSMRIVDPVKKISFGILDGFAKYEADVLAAEERRLALIEKAKNFIPDLLAAPSVLKLGQDFQPEMLLRDFFDQPQKAPAATPSRDFVEREADEFLKRGLVVGSMTTPSDKMEEKQTKYLEEIRNAVARPLPKIGQEARF